MKAFKYFFIFFCFLLSMPIGASTGRLWYRQPAQVWTDALPLGNGRLGAMVYGIPAMEQIQLNEETIWTGQPNANANPNALKAIPAIQELVWKGEYKKAQSMVDDKVMSKTNNGMAYEPFGSVYISMPEVDDYTDYYRALDLDSALSVTQFTANGVRYRREVVTSFSNDVVEVRLTASQSGKITFNANYATPQVDVIIRSEGDEATLLGVSSKLENLKGKVRFMGRMSCVALHKGPDGKMIRMKTTSRDGVISIKGADEAVLFISIATNFKNYRDISGDESEKSEQLLRAAMSCNPEESLKQHVRKFQSYMHRCSLSLGKDLYSGEPTDERLVHFAHRDDNGLVAAYFNFGRYLLICSSQPGGQPATLQGIWNDKMFPSWDSKYTTNINLEMNYWPAEVTNLSDLNGPLFQLIREVSQTGAQTARIMYGKDGWVLHHNTDIWRVTGAIDHASSGMWMTGGAWVCRHLWEHYLYTGDKEFLKEYYPIMKGAALFLDEMLVREPTHGWLVICPSVSPENIHPSKDGMISIAAGTTMDVELLTELFRNIISASRVLGIDAGLAEHYTERLKEFPPLQIGRWGQLQEWMQDWDDPQDVHRHVSHLYGLYPSYLITPDKTPGLYQAARLSLIHRGDEGTGWSMGWKVCLWARLLNGNHAYQLIRNQLHLTDDHFLAYGKVKKQGGTYRNLFDAHPPFQIDGNFGCTAGIAEMLVQSQEGFINLLPALPDVWKKEGEVKGMMARGNFEISDMVWRNGKVIHLTIRSNIGGRLKVKVNGRMLSRKTSAGKLYSII